MESMRFHTTPNCKFCFFIFFIFINKIQQGDFITIALSNFVEVWENILNLSSTLPMWDIYI